MGYSTEKGALRGRLPKWESPAGEKFSVSGTRSEACGSIIGRG